MASATPHSPQRPEMKALPSPVGARSICQKRECPMAEACGGFSKRENAMAFARKVERSPSPRCGKLSGEDFEHHGQIDHMGEEGPVAFGRLYKGRVEHGLPVHALGAQLPGQVDAEPGCAGWRSYSHSTLTSPSNQRAEPQLKSVETSRCRLRQRRPRSSAGMTRSSPEQSA